MSNGISSFSPYNSARDSYNLLLAHKIGLIGDSRPNNFRTHFTDQALWGFGCEAVTGSSLVLTFSANDKVTIPGAIAEYLLYDANTLYKGLTEAGAHPSANDDECGFIVDQVGTYDSTSREATAGDRGKYKTSLQNSVPGVAVAGVKQGYNLTGSISLAGDFSQVVVCKPTADAQAPGFGNGSANQQLRIYHSNTNKLSIYDGTVEVISSAGSSFTDQFHIFEWARTGSNVSFYRDGTLLSGPTSIGAARTITLDRFLQWFGGVMPATSVIFAGIYDHQLTATERGSQVVWLNDKIQILTTNGLYTTRPSTKMSDWLPTATSWVELGVTFTGVQAQNPFQRALSSFQAASVDTVLIDGIGANDLAAAVSAATYGTNLAAVIDGFVTAGLNVIVNPPYRRGADGAGGAAGYLAQCQAICAARSPKRVICAPAWANAFWDTYIGDTLYSSDALHPTTARGHAAHAAQSMAALQYGLRMLT